MNIEQKTEILIEHQGGRFKIRKDGVPEAGWYCVCEAMYSRSLVYNPSHLARHQAQMLHEAEVAQTAQEGDRWQHVKCWCLNRADGRRHEFLQGRGVGLCGEAPTGQEGDQGEARGWPNNPDWQSEYEEQWGDAGDEVRATP